MSILHFIHKFRLKRMLKNESTYSSMSDIFHELLLSTSKKWRRKYVDWIVFDLNEKIEIHFNVVDDWHYVSMKLKGFPEDITFLDINYEDNEISSYDLFTNEKIDCERYSILWNVLSHLYNIREELEDEHDSTYKKKKRAAIEKENKKTDDAQRSLLELASLNDLHEIKNFSQHGVSCKIMRDDEKTVSLFIYVNEQLFYQSCSFIFGNASYFNSHMEEREGFDCVSKLQLNAFAEQISEKILKNDEIVFPKDKPFFINEHHKHIQSKLSYLMANKVYLSLESVHMIEETIPNDLDKLTYHHQLMDSHQKKDVLINESLNHLLTCCVALRKEIEEAHMKQLEITHLTIINRNQKSRSS